jgi:hypothetical protein
MLTNLMPKNAEKFVCSICDFKCCKISNYNAHISTRKHNLLTNVDKKMPKNADKFICDCGKEYNHRQSLSIHKKKCIIKKKEEKKIEIENNNMTSELIVEIIKQNQEFKDLLIEQNKTIIELSKNNNNTIINNTNSHNKSFNLNLFLNETCKNAMNIMDFVDSIKIQLTDIESIGELGYVNGISKLIIKNLKALDEHMRPVHCSDMKRESLYVKDANVWEKEDSDNKKIKKAIKYIAHKNICALPIWKAKYPDYNNSESKRSDQYSHITMEAMGGHGDNDEEKANKIVKKIAKEVLINKNS